MPLNKQIKIIVVSFLLRLLFESILVFSLFFELYQLVTNKRYKYSTTNGKHTIFSPLTAHCFLQMSDKIRPLFKGHSDGRNPLSGQINLLAMKAPKTLSTIDTQPHTLNKVKIKNKYFHPT